MKKTIGIGILSMVFLIGVSVSEAFAAQSNVTTLSREYDTNRPGMDYFEKQSFDMNVQGLLKNCEDLCKNDSKCKAFSFEKARLDSSNLLPVPSMCRLKAGVPPSESPRPNFISGVKSEALSQLQEPNVQREKGPLSSGPATFKVNPGLLGPPKNLYNEYYKIMNDVEAAANPIFQKFTSDIAEGKKAINEYLTKLNYCSNQDHSIQECNPQEIMEACEKRLLASCLGQASNNVASRYNEVDADLAQLKTLAEKWGPIVCKQGGSWGDILWHQIHFFCH
jgi:hypothetical protein